MGFKKADKRAKREKKKLAIRKDVAGTPGRPRLAVYRSLGHIYAQLVDDSNRKTLATVSSIRKDLREELKSVKGKHEKAKLIGKAVAAKAQELNIKKVVFDRSGYLYHGRVKALADGAREGGLEF
jgi:large subunit ribosomal protein L18